MLNNNPRVLDERAISFKIVNGLLEVYDQKDFLVGDSPLPVPVEEGMSVDQIYAVANQCGYNIDEMIGAILQEAVMDNREYELWLSHEEVIFFSPSTQKWVSEPYEGIFTWMGEYFANEEESNEITEETEEVTEDISEDEEIPEEEETLEDEEVPEEGETLEDEEAIEEELEAETTEDEQEVKEIEEIEEETVGEDVTEDNSVEAIKFEKLETWKSAYDEVLMNTEVVAGVSMKNLMEVTTLIIMEENKDVFDLDEKEVLFKLVMQEKVVFDGITVLRAGLYNAHLFKKMTFLRKRKPLMTMGMVNNTSQMA